VNIDTGTITLTANASIDDVTISGGTLDLDSYTLEASGAWTRSAGTFDAGTGTVTLNGSAAENITSGGQAFNNLTIDSQGTETGLVGYWKFDETATATCSGGEDSCDSSGNGNHGTHVNNTTISTDVAPLSFTNDRSLSFDGVTDYVDLNTNLGITGELTVSAWVYPTQAPTGEGRTIISEYNYGGSPADLGWHLGYIYGSVDRFDFNLFNSSGSGVWVVDSNFFANNLNTWTHVLGVFKPSTYARLYVNDTLEGEDTSSVPAAIAYRAPNNLRIGARSDNASQGEWKGLIDDVRVYDRALTTAEISLLAQGDQLGASTYTLQDALDVNGDLTLTAGELAAGANSITVGGSWLNTAATFTAGTGTVTLNGTGTQTITSNSQSLYNMTVNKAAGTAQLSGALDLGGALTLSSGTFTPGADITVAGNFSQGGGTLNAGANSITVGGNWLNTAGTFTAGTGTVTLNGTGTQTITSNSQSLYNMTVNKAAGTAQLSGALDLGGALTLSSGTFTPGADITVAGNFSQGGGTLTAGANNIEVGGNWARSSGTFTAGTGTVSFTPNAAHSLSGDTTFYNFSLVEDDNAAGSSLTFAASSTTAISNTWTLQGNAGDVITLASNDPGVTQWNVDPQATRTLAYLSVADSNNQDLLNVDCLDNCANGGANSYWNFGSSFGVYGTVYSDEGTTPLSTVTVQAALNGTDSGSSAVTGADGVYQISDVAAIAAGDAVTVYLEGGAQKAVTLTLGDGQSLAGVDLYQDRLIVRHENAGPVTNTGIAAGIVADTDVTDIVDTSGTEITVKDGKELLVAAGYTLQLDDTFTTHDADIRGTLVDDGNTLEVSGSWAITGGAAYTATGTVRLTGTASETITSNGKAFNALTLNDGLIGYWKFDETAADSCAGGEDSCDSSGFGYHGTHSGGPTVSTSVAPVAFTNNRSLSFNGTTDGVKVPAALDPGQNLTLAVWVYPTADGQSSRSHIMGRSRDAGCCLPTYGIRRASNNTIDFDTYVTTWNLLNSGDTVPNNQWTHIVVWKSGATKRIYLNGDFVVEGTHSGTLQSSAATEFFGQLHSTQSPDNRRYQGLIDDARVYNRALDAAEISLLGQGYQPDTAQGTYTLQDALDANGDLTLAAGELAAGANSITVGGDWLNYGATFTAGTGAVTLDSAGSAALLSGGQAFYNLSFESGTFTLQDALSAAGVLTLTSGTLSQGASWGLTASDTAASGTALNIANGAALSNTGTGGLTLGGGLVNEGTLTLQSSDTANNGIAVRSSSAGVQRTWSGAGTFNLRDVDLKDQAVDTSTYPIRTPSSTNSGNNSRFRFWGMLSM
jgi:NADPH-dependent 7-cyano-7-deazaguanine reductase QueF-like protein